MATRASMHDELYLLYTVVPSNGCLLQNKEQKLHLFLIDPLADQQEGASSFTLALSVSISFSDPEYGSPFFLDCCGLIRRCLKDLRKSFGFNIGPWNQAYQFDTLPITVEREEDMQPGDLVFISATYNNPKSKKQKHDMTHVEIWLGDGHKTIGARWQKGKVQVFDSYKFEAKAYHSERYIFKSIDTWLMGICRSHCPQHTWKTRAQKFKPSKKSIFVQKQGEDNSSSQRQQQQQEQSASPSDSDSLRLEEEIVADDMARLSMTTVNVGDLDVHQGRLLMKDEECYHSDIDHDIENALDCYDDDTCGVDDDVDDVDEIEQNGNNNNNNSNEPDSTEKARALSPDVTPNDRRWKAETTFKKSPEVPRKNRTPITAQKDPTFFVGGKNGVALVEEALFDLGWKRLTNKYDESYKLKWVECKNQVNYHAFKTGEQLVNRIPNCSLLTNKMGLLTSLQRYDRTTSMVQKKGNRMRYTSYRNFFPETYRIDDPQDRRAFLDTHKPGEIWICKPTGMNQGKGIYLIRDIEAFQRHLEERDERSKRTKRPPAMERIVQRYIADPLLLEGRKFDIRAFMLIANTSPYLVLFHQGYARLCLHQYAQDANDLVAHLTNQFIQKKDSEYNTSKEDTVWSMQKFNDYVNLNYCVPLDLEYDWVYNVLTPKMKQIMLYCFNAVKNKLKCRLGYFDLYGLDFMIDSQMKVNLIEINVNPSLSTNCETLRDVIPGVVRESLYLSLECFEKSRGHRPLLPLDNLHEFEIIFNGSTPKPPPKENRSSSPDTKPTRGSPSLSFARSHSPIFFPRSRSPLLKTPATRKRAEAITAYRSKSERVQTAGKSAAKEHEGNAEKRASTPRLKTPVITEHQTARSSVYQASSAPMMLPSIDKHICSALDPTRSSVDPVKFKLTHHHYVARSGEAPGYYRSARLTTRRSPRELKEAITKTTATSAIAQCILSAFPKQSEVFQARVESLKTGEFPVDGYLRGTTVTEAGGAGRKRQGRLRDTKKLLLQSKPKKIARNELSSSSAPIRPLRRNSPQKSPVGLELCPVHPDGSRKPTKKSPETLEPAADEERVEEISHSSRLTVGDLKDPKRRQSAA
ncbi:hypothetical protein CAPTEDRAFT_220981 [Capitella teleta]|uniref:ATP-grasp domain-containing protein n=1 Tax=Capitella teleta TaxID=283909 RepID=R7TNN8_CAPTE|nr:hypothetical protein CAPTEDRAFT_220981 [Capitella teleta]|eukprot:ELT95483.1 hypothetical protein CAPTEDRAFT_220981 [Capitella teleta]